MAGPLEKYKELQARGELRPDARQEAVMTRLQRLHEGLCELEHMAKKLGLLGKLFGKKADAPRPKGLYIYGDVGRGKSMVMDLFFSASPIEKKRRIHFHQFMLEVHAAMNRWRKLDAKERVAELGKGASDDPLPAVVHKIAKEAQLLCFDEFQVHDITDASILGRLFEGLFKAGVTVVSTSNRVPDDLYKDGLNRHLFLPAIELIKDKMDVIALNGETDYRLDRMQGVPVYYTPINDETTEQLSKAFWALTDRDVGDPNEVPSDTITVQGRELFVPKALKGVAVFSFKRLCANPLGAADYLAIAWKYHTVFVVAIPQLGPENRNEAKRFVTMIDAFYENNVKLICSAAVKPEDLYESGDGRFEFDRTVSRLMEMQSEDYLARGHGVND